MRAPLLLSLLLVLPLAAGCRAPAESPDTVPAPDPGPAAYVGRVAVVGSAPVNVQTVLQTAEHGSLRLEGELESELRALAGAEVEVQGARKDGALRATDYTVLAVDDRPVVVGVVERVTDRYVHLRTETGELVYLSSAPASFQPGQKVWVQGPSSVIVQTYGTIRR